MSSAANYSDTLGVLYYGYSVADVEALAADPLPLSNQPSSILAPSITFLVLSWFCVCLRLHTRLRVVHAAGWDDLFIGLSLLTLTIGTIAVILACGFGKLGHHLLVLTPLQAGSFLLAFYIMNASYTISTAFIMISLLLQYTRLFEPGSALRRFCCGLVAFTAVWGFAYGFIAWFPCFPVKNFWLGNGEHCYGYGSSIAGPFVATYESHSAINMVLDLLVLAIPIPLYFERDTCSKTKAGLAGLLMTGAVVNFVSIWRFATVIQHRAATYPYHDPTWWGPVTITLANIEVALACVCASVPVFWPTLELRFGSRIFVEHEIEVRIEEDQWSMDHARGDSQAELGKMDAAVGLAEDQSAQSADNSFKDVYVLSQIDPLRRERVTVNTHIRSQSQLRNVSQVQVRSGSRAGGKRKWWRL